MGRGSFSSDGSSDAGGGAQLDLFSPPPKGYQHWARSNTKSHKTETPDTDTFPSESSDSESSEKRSSGGRRPGGHSRHSSMASAVSIESSHSRSGSGTYVGNNHGRQIQPFASFQPGASHHHSASSRPPDRYKTPDNQVTPPTRVQHLEKGLSSMELTNSRDPPALFVSPPSLRCQFEQLLTLNRIFASKPLMPTGGSRDSRRQLTSLATFLSSSSRVSTSTSPRSSKTSPPSRMPLSPWQKTCVSKRTNAKAYATCTRLSLILWIMRELVPSLKLSVSRSGLRGLGCTSLRLT